MFVHNIKLNKNKTAKILIIITVILAIFLLLFSIFSVYKTSKEEGNIVQENINIIEIPSNDYTNFLKDAHENIDDYIDMKVKLTGYVYRMPDFNNTQFVLSRTMILNSVNSGVVVGILTEYDNSSNFKDGEWVEVTGTIIRGNYKGEMPILKVINIKEVSAPSDEYVYPPTI